MYTYMCIHLIYIYTHTYIYGIASILKVQILVEFSNKFVGEGKSSWIRRRQYNDLRDEKKPVLCRVEKEHCKWTHTHTHTHTHARVISKGLEKDLSMGRMMSVLHPCY